MMNNIQAVAGVVIREIIRRKDFYVVFFLTALLVLLMGASRFFSEEKAVASLKDVCLLLIWLFTLVIAITTVARQIPAEWESGTIFPLLAKPVTRNEVVLGKFLGCWLASGMALLMFYLFFAVVSASREHTVHLALYCQALGAHWMLLAIITSMALLGSLVFAAPSSNSTICLTAAIAIWVLGRHLNQFALNMSEPSGTIVYIIYYLIPHLELFDLRQLVVHNYPPAPWPMWLGLLLYGAAYSALFLLAACGRFRRKALR
jgi:Cu-processing system permease protein